MAINFWDAVCFLLITENFNLQLWRLDFQFVPPESRREYYSNSRTEDASFGAEGVDGVDAGGAIGRSASGRHGSEDQQRNGTDKRRYIFRRDVGHATGEDFNGGLYGLSSYAVNRRTREFGVRRESRVRVRVAAEEHEEGNRFDGMSLPM